MHGKPTKSRTRSLPAEADDAAKLQEVIGSLREHASATATLQLVYVLVRTAWLVLIPQALGCELPPLAPPSTPWFIS